MTMSLLLEHFDDLLITPENAEQLNRVILQLAVQGKLVEQDPNDEPAKAFLDKAFAKKNSTGSLIELQPVQEEEKLFQVPESWEWVRLLEICTLRTGKKDVNQGSPKGKYPFFTCANKPLWSDEYSFEGPSLILPGNGANVGMAWLFDGKFEAYQRTYVLNNFLVNEKYIHFVFMGLWENHVKGKQSGSAINYIKLGNFEKFILPIPPLAEQQRIVARVEELFAQTRALAKELAHSQIELDGLNKSALSHLLASETPEEFNQHWDFIAEHFDLLFQTPEHVAPLRQSILELAVRGKLTRREAGDESAGELMKRIKAEKEKLGRVEFPIQVKESEKPFSLPDNWEWIRLEHLLPEYQNGLGRRVSANTGKERIILRLADLGSGIITTENSRSFILPEEEIAKYDLREGDILITRVNGSIDLIGSFTLVTESDLYSYCDHFIRMRLLIDNVLPVYLALVSKSNFVRKQIQEKFITTAGQKTVNQRHISSLYFPLPPLAEQERIVKRVEQLLSLCDALEGRLQSAEEERGRLVAAVMSTVNS